MKIKLKIALGVGLALFSGLVFAVRVSLLYQAELPVSTQTVEERNQMIQQGLAQVLIKVSGDNQVLNNPSVKTHLNAADQLLEQFSYASSTTNPQKPYLLQMDFDPEGVNKLLRTVGVPIWGQTRPLILVWLSYESPGHPAEIISTDSANNILQSLKQDADKRGLPIIFPVMDVTEINQISVNDIATMAVANLNTAAKRYASDAILIGRVRQDANQTYATQWKLVMGTDQWDWNITGKTMPDTLSTMIDNVTSKLASRYAVVMTNQPTTKLLLQVEGITEANDLTDVMNYIKHLTAVTDVQLVKVDDSHAVLSINLRSSKESFTQAILLSNKFTPLPASTNDAILDYQWNH